MSRKDVIKKLLEINWKLVAFSNKTQCGEMKACIKGNEIYYNEANNKIFVGDFEISLKFFTAIKFKKILRRLSKEYVANIELEKINKIADLIS